MTVEDALSTLAREPLRHIVLLKQLLAYPEHVKVHRVSEAKGAATLVALDTSVSAYDRQAYPTAAVAVFIASDHPDLTSLLLPHVPRGVGIVFKLASEADLAPVQAHFPVARRTAFVSFTSAGAIDPGAGVRVTSAPGDAAFRLFAEQDHDRAWLEPLLHGGKAFACVLERDGETLSPASPSRIMARYGKWAAWSPLPRSAAAWARASCGRPSPSSPNVAWRRATRSRSTTRRRSRSPARSVSLRS